MVLAISTNIVGSLLGPRVFQDDPPPPGHVPRALRVTLSRGRAGPGYAHGRTSNSTMILPQCLMGH
eukprot:4241221-Alexandrium_andersonii.AAC.1